MNTTPRHIVAIVVYTLALLSVIYVATLAWCVIAGLPVMETLGSFCHVGALSWMHHDWYNVRGTCQRCGAVLPMGGMKP